MIEIKKSQLNKVTGGVPFVVAVIAVPVVTKVGYEVGYWAVSKVKGLF